MKYKHLQNLKDKKQSTQKSNAKIKRINQTQNTEIQNARTTCTQKKRNPNAKNRKIKRSHYMQRKEREKDRKENAKPGKLHHHTENHHTGHRPPATAQTNPTQPSKRPPTPPNQRITCFPCWGKRAFQASQSACENATTGALPGEPGGGAALGKVPPAAGTKGGAAGLGKPPRPPN